MPKELKMEHVFSKIEKGDPLSLREIHFLRQRSMESYDFFFHLLKRTINKKHENLLELMRSTLFPKTDLSLVKQLYQERIGLYEDELTGLLNKRGFQRETKKMIDEGLTRFSLIVIDVDDFKQINDQFDHDIGNIALTAIANSLRQSVRRHDTLGRSFRDLIGRWGGDEFVVLLPNTPEEGVHRVELNLIKALADWGDAGTILHGKKIRGKQVVDIVHRVRLTCGYAYETEGDFRRAFHHADQKVVTKKKRKKRFQLEPV